MPSFAGVPFFTEEKAALPDPETPKARRKGTVTVMKLLLRLSREAIRYKYLYVVAIFSTFCLTLINLIAPRVLSRMTGIVSGGVDRDGLKDIGVLTVVLVFSGSCSAFSATIWRTRRPGIWWAICARRPTTSWSTCISGIFTTSRPAI